MAGRTAREVMAELAERYQTDAAYRAEVNAEDARVRAVAGDRARRIAPFREALTAAGVTDTYDRGTGLRYADPRIFETAFAHLDRMEYDDFTRGEIARSFETRGSATYWGRIKDRLLIAKGRFEADALAASLATSARSRHVGEMKMLVNDEALGSSRIFFLRPINRLDRTAGREFVLQFLDHPVLGTEADRIRRRVSRNA